MVHPLREFIVVEDEDKKDQFAFKLCPKSGTKHTRVYDIYAGSAAEKTDWIEALRHACEGGNQTKTSLEIEEKLRRNCYDIPAVDLEWGEGDIGKGGGTAPLFLMGERGLWYRQEGNLAQDNRGGGQEAEQPAGIH